MPHTTSEGRRTADRGRRPDPVSATPAGGPRPRIADVLRVGRGVVAGLGVVALVAVAGCQQPSPPAPVAPATAVSADTLGADADGQAVYVPVYSHIFFRDRGREIDLAATLSVRNVDLARPITLRAVRYHDSDGRLVRRYLEAPVELAPLASRAFVVEDRDRTGGVGASFVVRWEGPAGVDPPVVEAVMIGTAGGQGISFVTRGEPVGG